MDAELVGVRSPAGTVVLVVHGREVPQIAVAAQRTVSLRAGGPHMRVRGLRDALRTGQRMPLTLRVRDARGIVQEIDVSAEVRLRSPIDDERSAHAHGPAQDPRHAGAP